MTGGPKGGVVLPFGRRLATRSAAAPEFRLQGQRQPVERPCLHGPSGRRHQRGLRSSECPAPTLAAATPSDALNPSWKRYRNVRMQGRKRHSDNRHTLRTQPRTRPGKARCPTTRRATSPRTADRRGIMPEGQKQTIERPCQGHASGASDLWPLAGSTNEDCERRPRTGGRQRASPALWIGRRGRSPFGQKPEVLPSAAIGQTSIRLQSSVTVTIPAERPLP